MTGAPRVRFAAIDAGSNAIRLLIASAQGPDSVRVLRSERSAVRLGHQVFTRHILDGEAIDRAVETFRRFRSLMNQSQVGACRAVATSAAREADNRKVLVDRIRDEAGIDLEVIDGQEESRLERRAVLAALPRGVSPRVILDLGGGSLEMSFLKQGRLERSLMFPIGTVRLLEQMELQGPIGKKESRAIRRRVTSELERALRGHPSLEGGLVVACGGNANAMARLAPGPPITGQRTLEVRSLERRLKQILRLDVEGRMATYHFRRDRAEVMGIAAIILVALGQWLGARRLLVPGVGVREGIIGDLVEARFPAADRSTLITPEDLDPREGARRFAGQLGTDLKHAEEVRQVAVSLFDDLAGEQLLEKGDRVLLETAALLHDVGHVVDRKSHHHHGAQLISDSTVPGLRGWRRDLVASLVRYHNLKSEPGLHHPEFAALDAERRRRTLRLAAILRLAEGISQEDHGPIRSVRARVDRLQKEVRLEVDAGESHELSRETLRRKAGLFEEVFRLQVRLSRDRELQEKPVPA